MLELFKKHEEKLQAAVSALQSRQFFCAYPESDKDYDPNDAERQKQAFADLRDKTFDCGMSGATGYFNSESSPFGHDLGIAYPVFEEETTIERAKNAIAAFKPSDIKLRAGIAMEMLDRLNAQSFLLAEATHFTTGQGRPMAFQASGPHAQDRALEAIAIAYQQVAKLPDNVLWQKGMGKQNVRLDKQYFIRPRGIGLIIASATFPNWNSYGAIFANFMLGNPSIIKPHPLAVLPLAITVKCMRDCLTEFGHDPDLAQIAIDHHDVRHGLSLAQNSDISHVDFTGSPAFGQVLRDNINGKMLFSEEAGLNSILIESTDNFKAMCRNIAFSLSLYSGQMCTAPQNIFVPQQGIASDEGFLSFDDVAQGIKQAVDHLLSDKNRASFIGGALYDEAVLRRIETMRDLAQDHHRKLIRDSDTTTMPRTATPLIVVCDANDDIYRKEWFGPMSFIIAANNGDDCLDVFEKTMSQKGAISAAIYSCNDDYIERAFAASLTAGVPLSVNLYGAVWVNQSAAFSDYHVSGANPAGNACLIDEAYIANRYHVIAKRREV